MTAYDQAKEGRLGQVYLMYGTESAFVERLVDKLIEVSETSAVRFDMEEDGVEEALLELQSMSLFFSQPIVVLRNCTCFLAQGKSSSNAEALEKYMQDPIHNRTLVLVVPGEKVDERKKISKTAKRHIVVDCNTPKEPIALKLLRTFTKDLGVDIEQEALSELWRRTATVTGAMSELRKLGIYALNRSVTTDDVRLLVTPTLEETVFDWIDHVISGRTAVAFSQLTDIARQGYDPLALMAMLVRQFRMMWFALALKPQGKSLDAIAKEAKVHPYALRIADKQSRNFRLSKLEQIIKEAADYEYDVKRGKRDPQQVIELLILSTAASTSKVMRAQ